MKLPNNRTIADSWLPTFENVAREFIIDSLGKILCSDEIPNFKFEFRENGVRIDIWTHFMRECIINYVH